MKINLIYATSLNGVIGNKGKLPWNIPEDLKRFKELTIGNVVIMGRKTWESLGRDGLPNRTNIIVSSDLDLKTNNIIYNCSAQALDYAHLYDNEEIFIIGGASIYKQLEQFADVIYRTLVYENCEGDAYYNADLSKFKLESAESIKNGSSVMYSFEKWVKK